MANRWGKNGTVADFIFLGSKIAADGDLVQFSSVAVSCLTLCDPMNCSTPGLPVHHHLPEFTQTHVHCQSMNISWPHDKNVNSDFPGGPAVKNQPRGVGWGRRWQRGSRGRGHRYICGRFMLMYGRNQHNIVKQLSFN